MSPIYPIQKHLLNNFSTMIALNYIALFLPFQAFFQESSNVGHKSLQQASVQQDWDKEVPHWWS